MRLSVLLIIAILLCSFSARGAEYVMDKGHTRVLFDISHLGYTMMNGRFHEIEGRYSFDEGDPEAANVTMIIKTASVDMDHEGLNKKLISRQFLDAAAFPEIQFTSKQVTVTGENRGKLAGELKLHGVVKPITFNVSYNRGAVHPVNGTYTTGFTAIGALKRSDFGIIALLPNIGDDVLLRVEVEGQRIGDETETPVVGQTSLVQPVAVIIDTLPVPLIGGAIRLEAPTVND